MSKRFIKFIDSEESDYLLENYPNAFLLLCYIAKRARRTFNGLDGLLPGDSIIGEIESSKKCGLTTKSYRNAFEKLEELGLIETVFNPKNKSCQKRAIKRAIKSKIVNLCNTSVFDINIELEGDQKGDLGAIKGRSKGDKQERKERKNEKKDENEPSSIVPFSSFLEEESGIVPSEIRVFIENNHLPLSNTDLEAWCALYEVDRIIGTLKLMLSQTTPVKNPGGWLMTAFKDNYFQRNRNWEICQKFQRQYPSIKIKVLKSYCIVESTREEIPYSMAQDELVRKLNTLIINKNRIA